MDKTTIGIGLVMLAAGALGGYALSERGIGDPYGGRPERGAGMMRDYGAPASGKGASRAACVADGCLAVADLQYPAGDLPRSVQDALAAALADEYKARATYEAIIGQYGAVRPFSMIIRAEEMHISSFKALFDKYGIAVPADATGAIQVPPSIAAACAAGVAAKTANAALYDTQLIPAASAYPDIISVFTNLRDASQTRHLPAFERCAS